MNISLNGYHATDPAAPLRLVWFGRSVISDWNNPVATTVRATMEALRLSGHSVLFLEPRNNEPLVSALAARGSAMYRDFQRVYPSLRYRTYDMPRRAERDVWLSREAALVDAVIVQSDAPAEVFEWLGRIRDSPMVRVQIALDESAGHFDLFDVVLSPAGVGVGERFEPAVLPGDPSGGDRTSAIVAVYSDVDSARLRGLPGFEAAEIVASGAGAPENLPFVSEAALSERYKQVARALVVDADRSAFAAARSMLPAANNVETLRFSADSTVEPVEAVVDAREQSARLVELIHDVQERNRLERSPQSSHDS
jgi:hypothetical protein